MREIVIVAFSSLVAILLSISIFAGNTKDKLSFKQIFLMVSVGCTTTLLCWTFLEDAAPTKIIVRSILSLTFLATVLSKLIGNVITALTTISRERLQQLALDFTRSKMNLPKEEDTKEPE